MKAELEKGKEKFKQQAAAAAEGGGGAGYVRGVQREGKVRLLVGRYTYHEGRDEKEKEGREGGW